MPDLAHKNAGHLVILISHKPKKKKIAFSISISHAIFGIYLHQNIACCLRIYFTWCPVFYLATLQG